MSEGVADDGLLRLHRTSVKTEWIDEYGHMNMAHYLGVCDDGTYAFWEYANDNRPLEQRGGAEYAVVETHLNYRQEVCEGQPLEVATQLLGVDEKRFRLFHVLYEPEQGYVAATNEVMALGFDLNARKVLPFNTGVRERLETIAAAHARLPVPPQAGRAIAMPGNVRSAGPA